MRATSDDVSGCDVVPLRLEYPLLTEDQPAVGFARSWRSRAGREPARRWVVCSVREDLVEAVDLSYATKFTPRSPSDPPPDRPVPIRAVRPARSRVVASLQLRHARFLTQAIRTLIE